MKVLITGAAGQLGRSLLRTAPPEYSIDARTHMQLDLSNRRQIETHFSQANPDIVINAAAYTAVDRAESERERAFAINAQGVGDLARCCVNARARLVHVSTDYVFDGQSTRAYAPDAPTNPINAYGSSKLAGEQALMATTGLQWTIIRTSWVYSPWGANFLLTMLRLFRERGGASVVADQIGAPTSALSLAKFIWRVVASHALGVLHYTDAGVASWYDFAVAIEEEARAISLTPQATVAAIDTVDYPTPAKRPAWSLLATKASVEAVQFKPPHWRMALREVLEEVRSSRQ